MFTRLIAPLGMAALAAFGTGCGPAFADADQRISGPHVHRNLAIYFVHGRSAAEPVPLTLAEALAKGSVRVTETGVVSELRVENTGDEEVFIQAGDMVKGGRQDRVLTVSLLLPPRSGVVPISSFCVEPGRWSARAGEDPTRFASASEAMPSRRALLVMAAPPTADPSGSAQETKRDARQEAGPETGPNATRQRVGDRPASRQQLVWDSVAKTQKDLAAGLGVRVAAPQSATSLQLSLEHEALKAAQAPYLAGLEAAGLQDGDVIGYVAAVNGRPVSADIYPSNGLFRKVWRRQLAAVVTEAIGANAADASSAPTVGDVEAFLAAAERGKGQQRETTAAMRQETRDGDGALYNEARSVGGRWVHKNYLAW